MDFRLTFEGVLKSNGSPKHKHDLRRKFHPQLRTLWKSHPYLKKARGVKEIRPDFYAATGNTLHDDLRGQFTSLGYRFVPLVAEHLSLICSLDILFLRPSMPGALIQSGDLDGRMKTLFDALRMPATTGELGGYDAPAEGEDPFYCLLQDDKLITHVSITTDTLLEPTSSDAGVNDTRLIVAVQIRPFDQGWHNINFGAG